jgi:DNA-binding response OmpR family regulator
MVRDLLAGHHVIVVDDDERLLALARLALQKQGIRVSTAATAEEGRKLIGADPPDLVILDIVLPDMSGWEVLRRIRETDDCLVMLLSGRDSDIDKARGLDLGADDYLTKPFSFLEFEARVRALLRRAPDREHAGGEHAGGEHAGGTDTETVTDYGEASVAEIDRALPGDPITGEMSRHPSADDTLGSPRTKPDQETAVIRVVMLDAWRYGLRKERTT